MLKTDEMRKTEIIQPKILRIDNTHYILLEDYTYSWKIKGANPDIPGSETDVITKIRVNKGFRWDGASIPKFLWSFNLTPDGKHRAAALIHDFIYVHEGKLPAGSIVASYGDVVDEVQYGSFSRKDADRLFGHMLKKGNVKSGRRRFMKWGVTNFGWIYWTDGPDLIKRFIYRVFVFCMLSIILFFVVSNFIRT